ncbi:MAG TPA: TldD/PmbA family protein [Candidatus Nanoarchaeia archaeon]|nr:TldD/PmbA family protein [Candidatus Nanoarchaeia archaeon]
MEKFLKYGEKRGCSYLELKSYSSTRTSIELLNDEIKDLSQSDSRMYSAKVIYKGSEGLTYSNNEDFRKLIDNAVKLARSMKKEAKIAELPKLKKKIKTKYKISPMDVSLEDKKKKILKLDLRKSFKKINSIKFSYGDSVKNIAFINTEGRNLEWDDVGIGYLALSHAKEGNRIEQFHDLRRNHKGFELFDEAEECVKESMSMAEKMLEAKESKGGNYPVIIDQRLGGVFSHEAVGHACEADTVIQGVSVMSGKLRKLIASTCVNIIDDGSKDTLSGWIPFDDEGSESKKTYLIKQGFLEGYLHTRETAKLMNMDTTGNGRSESLGSRPIPRMTNTFFDTGDSSFKEMLQTIKEGYYLKRTLGGQVSPGTGEFLFNAQYGYKIINGELKELVKGVSLTGSILNTLKNISLVAKDLKFSSGMCGKDGQHVPVGDGSPHVKIDLARVGGKE